MVYNNKCIIAQNYVNRYNIWLILTLMVALALRIWGIKFGLPHIYHTDEWFEVKRALKLGAGVFDTDRIYKGGYFYLLFVEYGIYFLILKLLGIVKSVSDFLYGIFQDPTPIWMMSRLTTAVIGTLNCYLLYLLGKKIKSRLVGICAAGFMATNLIHVQSSHYVTVDVPLTCLITICLLIMYWKQDNSNYTGLYYILLGFFTALAVMTKIPGVIILFPVLIFHYQNIKASEQESKLMTRFIDKRIMFFCISFTGFYILGNPGIINHVKGIIYWAFSFIDVSHPDKFRPQFPQAKLSDSLFLYYFKIIFPLRYLMLNIFILGGIIISFKNRVSGNLSFLLFITIYLFLLCRSENIELIYPRYILPLTPFLFIYAGIFIDFLVKSSTSTKRIKNIFIGIIIVVSLYYPVNDAISYDKNLGLSDTRTLAKIWAHKNIAESDKIIIEGRLYKVSTITIPLKMKPELIDEAMSEYFTNKDISDAKSNFYKILKKSLKNQKTYHLILTGNRKQLLKALEQRNIDYIILRESTKIITILDENKRLFPEMYRVVSWADSDDFELVKTFKSDQETRGPTLLIFKRKNNE